MQCIDIIIITDAHTNIYERPKSPLSHKLTCLGPGAAGDLSRVVAWVAAVGDMFVEEKTVGALVLRGHSLAALRVSVAVAGVRVVVHVFRGAVLGPHCGVG